jgi:hypothetical protein
MTLTTALRRASRSSVVTIGLCCRRRSVFQGDAP